MSRIKITIRDLARNPSPYLNLVKEGQEIEIVKQDQIIALLVPLQSESREIPETVEASVSLASGSQLDRLRWLLGQAQFAITSARDVRTKMSAIKEARQISKEYTKATGESATPGSRVLTWERMPPSELISELEGLIKEVKECL